MRSYARHEFERNKNVTDLVRICLWSQLWIKLMVYPFTGSYPISAFGKIASRFDIPIPAITPRSHTDHVHADGKGGVRNHETVH